MKKIFILITCFAAFNAFSQTVGGSPGSPIDDTTNPSGQAFGGAMGGGPTSLPSDSNSPTATSPTTVPQGDTEYGYPRGNQFPQERMEDTFPSTTVPQTGNYPDTPVAPSVPPTGAELPRTPTQTVPDMTTPNMNGSGSGVGTGTP